MYTVNRFGLTIGEHCEGCGYQILTRKDKTYVAASHLDWMHDLTPHETVFHCRAIKKERDQRKAVAIRQFYSN